MRWRDGGSGVGRCCSGVRRRRPGGVRQRCSPGASRDRAQASLEYVDGSVVDFKESLMGAGFEVNNPNVVAACGCGSSFRVADDEDAEACASTK